MQSVQGVFCFLFFLFSTYIASSLFCFLRLPEVKIESFAWLCIVIYLSYPYKEQFHLIFDISFFLMFFIINVPPNKFA